MAETQKMQCPNCKAEISVDAVLQSQIESRIRSEYETKQKKDQEAIAAREAELAKEKVELEAAKKETDKLVADAVAKEKAELTKKTAELEEAKRNTDIAISNAVKEQLVRKELEIQKQAKADAEGEQKQKLELLNSQLAEKDLKLQESKKQEIEFLKKKAEFEEKERNLEIEKLKQIESERAKITEEAKKKAAEEQANIIAQKDKQIQDALKAKDELTRKLEQGSQQAQGEVAELNLEEELRTAFVFDNITPVPKGTRGADVIQKVLNRQGKDCGQIIWEVKQTKAWSDGWVAKLKDDQREVSADIAIIVSHVLPNGVKNFALYDGVWICEPALAIPLAGILRGQMEAIAREKGLAVGKNEKQELLYQYITGVQFRQRLEAIVETIQTMQADLNTEKKQFQKKWAKSEKQIERVVMNMFGMYGDLSGMAALPQIPTLEIGFDDTTEE